MKSLTKHEIERVRHVNEMKKRAAVSDDRKLVYFSGANLVLMVKDKKGIWLIEDETGQWFDSMFEMDEMQ